MSPWIVGFLAFYLYPMLATLYYSFTHYDILSPPRWVGFSNYTFMFAHDPQFWLAMRNTIWMILVATPIQVVFAIGCAMVLTRPKRGVGIYRTIFFLPTMVPVVAAPLGFLFILNPAGPIDHVLGLLHVPKPLWFQDPNFATFLHIFANPNSRYKQITTLGLTDATLFGTLADKYLAGKISDLQTALQKLATQIDNQLKLGG